MSDRTFKVKYAEVEALQFDQSWMNEAEDFCGGWEFFDYDLSQGFDASIFTYIGHTWAEVYDGDWIVKTPNGLKVVTDWQFQLEYIKEF